MASKNAKFASIFARLAAFLIDFSVIIIAINLPIWIMANVFNDPLASAVLSLLNVSLTSAYLIYFTSVSGQTFGKKLLKIKVVDIKTSKPPSLFNAFLRETVGKALSAICLMLGFLASIPDYKNRTWHDRIAGTVVIKKS